MSFFCCSFREILLLFSWAWSLCFFISYFSDSMSLGETVIFCGLEGLFLCESYPLEYSCLENHGQRSLAGRSPWGCRAGQAWVTEHIPVYPLRVALLVWGLIFVGIPATFSVCAGCCPLGKGCEWFCGDQTACAGCWAGASSLLCGCHSPAWGRVSCGVAADRSISKLQCEVGTPGVLLLGAEPLNIPPQEPSTRRHALWWHVPPLQSRLLLALPSALPRLGDADRQLSCPSATVLTKPPVQICWPQVCWSQTLGPP